jgi:hypothetical protein
MAKDVIYVRNTVQKAGLRFYGKRMYYDELMSHDQDSYLDLWYSKPLYGKIDTKFNPVECAAAKLDLLIDDRGNSRYYALGFVADAFEAMRIYVDNMHTRGAITKDAFFYPLRAHSGWVSTNNLYRANIDRVYELFRNDFLTAALQRKVSNKLITNFDNYLPVFLEFLNHMTSTSPIPLTRSGFILKSNPYSACGLMVEIANEQDSSNDQKKYDEYFSDNQFSTYVDVAAAFGFYVDMNVPWRLVANLESDAWVKNPALSQILDNRFEGTANSASERSQRVFDECFYRPEMVSFEEFKLFAYAFYNTFVDKEPSFDSAKVIFNKSTGPAGNLASVDKVVRKTTHRRKISMQDMMSNYGDLYWLRLYYQLRLKEMRLDITEHQIMSEVRELEQRFTSVGLDLAIQYISERLMI